MSAGLARAGTRACPGIRSTRSGSLRLPTYKGQNLYLGYYISYRAAARAYDAKARELGVSEERLNFPKHPCEEAVASQPPVTFHTAPSTPAAAREKRRAATPMPAGKAPPRVTSLLEQLQRAAAGAVDAASVPHLAALVREADAQQARREAACIKARDAAAAASAAAHAFAEAAASASSTLEMLQRAGELEAAASAPLRELLRSFRRR